nr:hypothetical protein [uncultured Flavobacterium sp.]
MKKNVLLLLMIVAFSCNLKKTEKIENTESLKPITTIESAKIFVKQNFKSNEETLLISDELNDPVGMNMAIIGNEILGLGYNVNGFEQKKGYRIYKFKK